MWLADLHVHSSFSDGKMSIPELVDFYGQKGFGCIAVTDHVCEEKSFIGKAASYLNQCMDRERFPAYLDLLTHEARRAKETYNMVVIPGFELSKNSISNHRSAHILGIGISRYMSADGDPVDLARAIRNQGGLAIVAHPVSTRSWEPQTYYLWSRRKELALEFDAWEVASGKHLFHEVLASGLPMIATSDLHQPRQVNSWKTQFRCDRNQESILEAIRKQELNFVFYQEKEVENLVLHRNNYLAVNTRRFIGATFLPH
ncbi:MAG: phosphotransferase [Bdellovibrio sp. CG10_big_fil_rev_8_21_14_0_10_47_8]|nr:MAG: phosphotransferase [Bdellovibrio sp. CG10_big_fil_rev_8_21_14_0_10_47_8]